MKFPAPLVEGILLPRYKRFLADVELGSGGTVTAACPNTGSMMGCGEPGSRVWLSESDSPTRKYRHTWELVESEKGHLDDLHAHEALALGVLIALIVFFGLFPSAVLDLTNAASSAVSGLLGGG